MRRGSLPLASLAFCSAATAALGQGPEPKPSLAPQARVRVEASGPEISEGRFEQFRGDTLIVQSRPGTTNAIPLARVSRVWVRGRSTRTGMIAGGIVGVPLGVLVGAGLCDFERNFDDGSGPNDPKAGCTEHYIVTPLVTAALGAGIGALIGHFIPRWNLRFSVIP